MRQVKKLALATGLYRSARVLRRALTPTERSDYRAATAFYKQFIRHGDLCFDIGANVGEKTEVFLALGARVVAFEPQPSCFREMKARCGSRRVVAINAALGDEKGELPMYLSKQSGASSLISDWARDVHDTIQVPITTLDQAIDEHGLPQFCKIDVEGYEWEVLKGLSRPLPSLSIEYHHTEKDIEKIFNCVDHLSRFGDLHMNVTRGEGTNFFWSNWISYDSFRKYFPAHAPRTEDCGFGDLFIRM